jgi:hypothetical protein
MAELLPHSQWEFLEQKGGWLLMKDTTEYVCSTNHYLLYDLRRGHLAMAFSIGKDMKPIIGKATLDKVQLYYGYVEHTPEDSQYYWYVRNLSVIPNMPSPMINLIWHNQTPTNDAIETVRKDYHTIMEHVKKQGYWFRNSCYEVGQELAKKIDLQLPKSGSIVLQQYLIDNLFLLEYSNPWLNGVTSILVHSSSSEDEYWKEVEFICYKPIPEEKIIVMCKDDPTSIEHCVIQLLSMDNGEILKERRSRRYESIRHIIGSLCRFCGDEDKVIDIRTDEEIRPLKLNQRLKSWIVRSCILQSSTGA